MESMLSINSLSAMCGNSKSQTDVSEDQLRLKLVQKGVLETTEENIALGKEISSLLCNLGLEPKLLSNDVKEGLQKVAVALKAENLSDLDESELSIVMERKMIMKKKKQREEAKLSLMYDNLFRKYTAFQRKLECLERAVNSLQSFIESGKKEDEESYSTQILLLHKLNEYQQTVEKLESDLHDMQVQELYPENILKKYKQHSEMTGELAELNKSLSQFSDLPPNLPQAKILLTAKEKEYEVLEQKFLEKTN